MAAPATRLLSTGELLVNGSFDENTSIAPSMFRTTSDTVYAGTLDEVSLDAGAINFNGTTQYLTTPANAAFTFGTGDFTIECWIYTNSSTTQRIVSTGNSLYEFLLINSGANVYLDFFDGTVDTTTGTNYVPQNQWVHVAVSRAGTALTLFINGVVSGSSTNSVNLLDNGTITIGRYSASATNYFSGYISNLRIVKGTALYTADFATPQSVLLAITGTSLLLDVINSTNFIKDNSTNNFTITNNGTATWTTIGPFNQGSTTLVQRQVSDGTLEIPNQFDELSLGTGAIAFNGTTQSLSIASNTAFQMTTNDFTLECWVYPRASTSQAIFDNRTPNAVTGFDLTVNVTGPSFKFGTSGTNYLTSNFATLNKWYHVAVVRGGSTLYIFQNGTLGGTFTLTTQSWTNSTPTIGGGVNGFFNGYISNLRLVKGTALYTSNFTPAQSILPAITGTSFLLNATDSANFIKDNGPNNFTATNNGTATWTAVGPFNT